MTRFPFDELNTVLERLPLQLALSKKEEIEDDIEELLILSYVYGGDKAGSDLNITPKTDVSKLEAALYKDIDGKTFKDRLDEYIPLGNYEDIKRVVETETHRLYTTGEYDTAMDMPQVMKKWVTMKDERVRMTHDYLEGMEVDLNEPFFTFDGDSAMFPGDFTLAENNVNCRCELEFSYKG